MNESFWERRLRPFWRSFAIEIFLFVVVFALSGVMYSHHFSYVDGLECEPRFREIRVYVISLMAVPGAAIFLLLRMVLLWKGKGRSNVIAVLFPIVCFSMPIIALSASGSHIPAFLRGFSRRIEDTFDVHEVREWILNLEGAHAGDFLDLSEAPRCVRQAGFESAQLEAQNVVRFYHERSGGFVEHWGMVVGPENMDVPRTDNLYRLECAKGAYLWSE